MKAIEILMDLSVKEKEDVYKSLDRELGSVSNKHCPKCSSLHIYLHGKDKFNNVRYRCKECGKTFINKSLSETFGLKDVEGYLLYKQEMVSWGSIKIDAEKFGKSKRTIVSWRKRILKFKLL